MKKVLFSFCFLLVLLVGSSLRLEAQPAQKLVNVEAFRLLYPEASNYREMYLVRLLFFYTENRILKDIRKTVRALLQSSPDETGQRLEMLVHIAERRELLRHVAENLDRPGTVWG